MLAVLLAGFAVIPTSVGIATLRYRLYDIDIIINRTLVYGSVTATLVVRRVQALVDRRFYRRKYDAARTLAAFNSSLRKEIDLDSLSDEVLGVVRETVQPAHASLWLRPTGPDATEDMPS